MMKNSHLISSLVITLFIFLGSINKASALKCYHCKACSKNDVGKLEDCEYDNAVCVSSSHGDTTGRYCAPNHPGIQLKCTAEDIPGPHGKIVSITSCYCNTEGCNGSYGSIQTSPMCLWLFFTLSVVVPWMRSALGNGHWTHL